MIGGLILAAGAGQRFGPEPKLLATLRGRPLLEHAVSAQCAVAKIDRVAVVLGAHADAIQRAVRFGRAEITVCPNWDQGQSASLRAGIRALAGADRVIVTLGDAPLLTAGLISRFIDAAPRTRATFGGRPGHPVVLGPDEINAIARLTGDVGARELLLGGPVVECGPSPARLDVDTPADLLRIQAELRALQQTD